MNNQNFNIVNLAHENKLIYIGPYIHTLKGMIISPISADRSLNPQNTNRDLLFRTFPIVGEDWQVVDDSWNSFDAEFGFDNHILGSIGECIPVNHNAILGALEEATDLYEPQPLTILNEAERLGANLTDEGLDRIIELEVIAGFNDNTFTIGNSELVQDDLEMTAKSNRYIVADLAFKPGLKESYDEKTARIYNEEELLFRLKRAIGAYADHFHRSGIRVKVDFKNGTPKSVRKMVKRVIHQLNTYMEFIDEINQYESQTSKTNR